MTLGKVLLEFKYYGPAENLETLAREVRKRKGSDAAHKWASNEIRTMLNSYGSGSGATVHDKLNRIASLISALNLYLDPEFESDKDKIKQLYKKTVERSRAGK